MNYEFQNLCGATYTGGDLCFLPTGSELFTPVGNRFNRIDLVGHRSRCIETGASTNITRIAFHPKGNLSVIVDQRGLAILHAFGGDSPSGVMELGRASLGKKGKVRAVKFSPGEGKYLAVASGRFVVIWETPSSIMPHFNPLVLHRTHAGFNDDVTSLDWSPCGSFLIAGSMDLTCKIFSVRKDGRSVATEEVDHDGDIEEMRYVPPTLSGHREAVVGVSWGMLPSKLDVAFDNLEESSCITSSDVGVCYSVSIDGALAVWAKAGSDTGDSLLQPSETMVLEKFKNRGKGAAAGRKRLPGAWRLASKHFFNQVGATITCASFHYAKRILAAGFSAGHFSIFSLPDAKPLQTLSVSRAPLSDISFHHSGEWLAMAAATLGQILVWDWSTENYVLRQQGHPLEINSVAYSSDGAIVATAGDDARLKLWNVQTGFCFVTFDEHEAPITAVAFTPGRAGRAVITASLDGTVRAFDTQRYRNFRTFTGDNPRQFSSLAVDSSGEVVAAGTADSFEIMLWSMKTGKLLECLVGHTAPISELAFGTGSRTLLASSSWDRTVKLWDCFGDAGKETLQHTSDCLALCWRPDGRRLCCATLDGQLSIWDTNEGVTLGVIDGRRDIQGGRSVTDRRAASNISSKRCFRTISYTADGAYVLAGGDSKYVCLYDAEERLLMKRFCICTNVNLDGVLEILNSKRDHVDAGPLDLLDVTDSDDEDLGPSGRKVVGGIGTASLAGSARGELTFSHDGSIRRDPGARSSRQTIRAKSVRFSPSGRGWGVASTEGLLLYSLDRFCVFDPTNLTEDATTDNCIKAIGEGKFNVALSISYRLGDFSMSQRAMSACSIEDIFTVASNLSVAVVAHALEALTLGMEETMETEKVLKWSTHLLTIHGPALQQIVNETGRGHSDGGLGPVLKAMHQRTNQIYSKMSSLANETKYALEYMANIAPQDEWLQGESAGEDLISDQVIQELQDAIHDPSRFLGILEENLMDLQHVSGTKRSR